MVVEGLIGAVDFLNSLVPFLNPYFLAPGLLLLLIPIIAALLVLYTIRSHPKDIKIPSLIFILDQGNKMSPRKFFRRLPLNLLLLLHILFITCVIVAAAQPYILLPQSEHSDDVVIVIDASMSMQAADRFEQAKQQAANVVGKSNTIIAVYDTPHVIAQDVNPAAARSLLNTLKPSDSTTALHAALQHVVDLDKNGATVHIYSDGIPSIPATNTIQGITARIQGQNNAVFFHQIKEGTNNVGIVNAQISLNSTVVQIKNYNQDARSVDVQLSDRTVRVELPANGVATARFTTPPEKSTLSITAQDEVQGDNTLYISAPQERKQRVLYISNNPNPYLQLALSLMDFVEVTYDQPPGEDVGNYDAYIVDSVNPDLLLPTTISDIAQRVNSSAGLIVLMDPTMVDINWHGLLPVQPSKSVIQSPILLQSSKHIEDVAIGGNQPHVVATPNPGAEILALGQESPVLARKQSGNGVVYYYGLQDNGDFVYDFTFPLLFKRWLEDATLIIPVEESNIKIGEILGTPDSTITLPDGTSIQGQVAPKNAGFYEVDSYTYAVNTLSDAESAISATITEAATGGLQDISSVDVKIPYALWSFFVMAALAILITEYLLLKWRGDA